MNRNNKLFFSEVIMKEVADKMSGLKTRLHRSLMNIFFTISMCGLRQIWMGTMRVLDHKIHE